VPCSSGAVCQSLRILSFSVTQLPAPNYHCRTPEPTAIKAMPEHWWGHFYIQNLKQQVSCGVSYVGIQ
jgi:sphingomyelin synthase-related protein 1